ncbi:hypothetical protein PG984_001058 [Apiospora sp. TS-2023a]
MLFSISGRFGLLFLSNRRLGWNFVSSSFGSNGFAAIEIAHGPNWGAFFIVVFLLANNVVEASLVWSRSTLGETTDAAAAPAGSSPDLVEAALFGFHSTSGRNHRCDILGVLFASSRKVGELLAAARAQGRVRLSGMKRQR